MRFAISNQDGSVGVMTVVPTFVTVENGAQYAIIGVRRDELVPDFGLTKLYGNGFELVVGDLTYDIGLLERDTIPGFTLFFPDPQREVQRWPESARRAVTGIRALLPSEVLPPRLFRNAWTDAGRMTVDMVKARDIWRDLMRVARDPLFAPLDAAQLSAVSATSDQSVKQLEAEKQVLRDVTADPGIDAAQTPEDLARVWPLVLGAPPVTATADATASALSAVKG